MTTPEVRSLLVEIGAEQEDVDTMCTLADPTGTGWVFYNDFVDMVFATDGEPEGGIEKRGLVEKRSFFQKCPLSGDS